MVNGPIPSRGEVEPDDATGRGADHEVGSQPAAGVANPPQRPTSVEADKASSAVAGTMPTTPRLCP